MRRFFVSGFGVIPLWVALMSGAFSIAREAYGLYAGHMPPTTAFSRFAWITFVVSCWLAIYREHVRYKDEAAKTGKPDIRIKTLEAYMSFRFALIPRGDPALGRSSYFIALHVIFQNHGPLIRACDYDPSAAWATIRFMDNQQHVDRIEQNSQNDHADGFAIEPSDHKTQNTRTREMSFTPRQIVLPSKWDAPRPQLWTVLDQCFELNKTLAGGKRCTPLGDNSSNSSATNKDAFPVWG